MVVDAPKKRECVSEGRFGEMHRRSLLRREPARSAPKGAARRCAEPEGCASIRARRPAEPSAPRLGEETMMCMPDKVLAKRDEIYAIARKHKAEKLWVFGSCARKGQHGDDELKEGWNG